MRLIIFEMTEIAELSILQENQWIYELPDVVLPRKSASNK